MEIPYTVKPRPDTGLANPKLGIWLFLASEVMLFGGLFAGYIFMRLSAEPWMWPKGWLNVPVGTFNTFILIFSSVTIILSWESLKMHKRGAFMGWLAATWICGLAFLAVKLGYEWPDKFGHFGAYIKAEATHKYESFLGNEDPVDAQGKPVLNAEGKPEQGRISRGVAERRFISGHLAHSTDPSHSALALASVPYISPEKLDGIIGAIWSVRSKIKELEPKAAQTPTAVDSKLSGAARDVAEHERLVPRHQLAVAQETEKSMVSLLPKYGMSSTDITNLLDDTKSKEEQKKLREAFLEKINFIRVEEVDPENANPYDPDNDKAHFWPRAKVEASTLKGRPHIEVETEGGKEEASLVLNKADLIEHHGAFLPKLNTYLATYFMITGLHGLHVLGGCIVFIYFFLQARNNNYKYYHQNHAQLCNRIEVAGLFWHLVDLIWIFVFPLFYLL